MLSIFMTFPTTAFAYRLHLSHALLIAIPISLDLGRHEEGRSWVLKLQMSVRRHSVILPFDHPCADLYASNAAHAFLLRSLGNKGLWCAPPHHTHLTTQKSNPLDKPFHPCRHIVLFFLNERFQSRNQMPDLIYSNYLTQNPSATLQRATEISSSNIYTYIQI